MAATIREKEGGKEGISNAMKNRRRPEVLIATLGVEPQVVTILLDRLLEAGRKVREVAVVYTKSSGIHQAMAVIEEEFGKQAPDFDIIGAGGSNITQSAGLYVDEKCLERTHEMVEIFSGKI